MRKSDRIRRQREAVQMRISFLFCSIIAVFMFCSILFGTIHTQAAPAETTHKYYTSIEVESGDTLWEIAGEYISDEYSSMNEYITEICSINHISKDEIRAGQCLVLPYYSTEAIY